MPIKLRKKWNSVLLVVIALIIPYIIHYIHLEVTYENSCIMDALRLLLQSKCLDIIILMVAIYESFRITDYSVSVILLSGSKKKVLRDEIIDSMFVSAFIAILCMLTAIVMGYIGCEARWMNWMDTSSRYAQIITGYRGYHTTIALTVFLGFLFIFLQILVTLLMIICNYWFLNSCIYALLLIGIVSIADMGFQNIFYDRFTIKTYMWSVPGYEVVINILVLLLLFIAIGILLMRFSGRKEFFHGRDD